MSNRTLRLVLGLGASLVAGISMVHADTLLIKRVQEERGMHVPHRGMTMKQVRSQFGAPNDEMNPAGGDAPKHPIINRWVYPDFIVYFEKNIVIDSVANRATPTERGPVRPTRR